MSADGQLLRSESNILLLPVELRRLIFKMLRDPKVGTMKLIVGPAALFLWMHPRGFQLKL
jgi:hypothetical protein